jgi:DNA-binding NtrC family response regulator
MNRPRALIVDDHGPSYRLFRRIFLSRGWDVQTSRTATYALWHLSTPYDCIVTQLRLPDGTGESILEAVDASRMRTTVAVIAEREDEPWARELEARFKSVRVFTMPLDVRALAEYCLAAKLQ